jgi:hypothetical protein
VDEPGVLVGVIAALLLTGVDAGVDTGVELLRIRLVVEMMGPMGPSLSTTALIQLSGRLREFFSYVIEREFHPIVVPFFSSMARS